MVELPTGFMDNKTISDDFDRNNFSLYDVNDEEVHFTRHSFQLNHYKTHDSTASESIQRHTYRQIDTDLTGQLNSFADIKLDGDRYVEIEASQSTRIKNESQEQARSCRLLSSIGTKLRRGSNYLTTPSMVGGYLLGITIREWSEFFDTSHMMKVPTNTHHLARRLICNLSHFRGNYLCVALILIIYCILSSPFLLFAIVAYLSAIYFVTARTASGRAIKIANFRPNLQQQYYFLTLISIPLLWVAGAPSAVFWVIGASFVVVGLHASIYSIKTANNELSQTECHADFQIAQPANFVPTTAIQYYNHQKVNHYLPLSTPDCSQVEEASKNKNWTLFKYLSGRDQKHRTSGGSGSACGHLPKVPEVTIISQDFAGLGRVYEV